LDLLVEEEKSYSGNYEDNNDESDDDESDDDYDKLR